MTPQRRSLERRIERLEAIFAAERLEQERELETQVGQKGRIQAALSLLAQALHVLAGPA